MVLLDGIPSCPSRVGIAPPKLDYSSGRVFLNPNETMAQKALKIRCQNHNNEERRSPTLLLYFSDPLLNLSSL